MSSYNCDACGIQENTLVKFVSISEVDIIAKCRLCGKTVSEYTVTYADIASTPTPVLEGLNLG